jgi:hypothetical protein
MIPLLRAAKSGASDKSQVIAESAIRKLRGITARVRARQRNCMTGQRIAAQLARRRFQAVHSCPQVRTKNVSANRLQSDGNRSGSAHVRNLRLALAANRGRNILCSAISKSLTKRPSVRTADWSSRISSNTHVSGPSPRQGNRRRRAELLDLSSGRRPARYLSAKTSIAASATARVDAP